MSEPIAAPRVSIIIVGFEDPASLRACLASLRAGSFLPHRVVLVDNSLSDALENAFSRDPGLDYLRPGANVGFSRGCNLGIARAVEGGADHVLLLNPDTVLEPECLAELTRAAEAFPEAGIIGGRIHYLSNPAQTWYAGGRLDHLTGVGTHLALDPAGTIETGYVTGCCMLIPGPALARLHGLREDIFMYLDDAEFCMRARRAGFRLYYNPHARLGHRVGPGADWRRYPDYYLYFSVRNKPLIAQGRVQKAYLHGAALVVAAGKMLRYGLARGVPERGRKLRALAWAAWDSLFAAPRHERRLPALFRNAAAPRAA